MIYLASGVVIWVGAIVLCLAMAIQPWRRRASIRRRMNAGGLPLPTRFYEPVGLWVIPAFIVAFPLLLLRPQAAETLDAAIRDPLEWLGVEAAMCALFVLVQRYVTHVTGALADDD